MKTVILGDRETITLFALDGVEGRVVESAQAAQEEIRRIRRAKAYGLLVVTEQVVEWASDAVSQLRFSRELPIVLDIPGPEGHRKGVKQLPDYIREAVGIRV